MSEVELKVKNFIKEFGELENLYQSKNKELSAIDLELSSWYHNVEGFMPTHNTQAHALMKRGKDILQRRRLIKQESMMLQTIIMNLTKCITQTKNTLNSQHIKQKKLMEEIITNANL